MNPREVLDSGTMDAVELRAALRRSVSASEQAFDMLSKQESEIKPMREAEADVLEMAAKKVGVCDGCADYLRSLAAERREE